MADTYKIAPAHPADSFSMALPGEALFDAGLIQKFEAKRKARGQDYQPRTRHLRDDGWAKYTNRLFLESSPYLLQHAHNPVNWYPWGTEAFETAKNLNRPLLLSIGYSTCHWCHVMEEESFEDEEIARYLNEHYIAIKVDREERPDIDAVYMIAVQALTGGGGWPLNVWLMPDKKPFYGGTYFPARDWERGTLFGFLTILKRLNESFVHEESKVLETSRQLTEAIQQIMSPKAGIQILEKDVLNAAAAYYKQQYDLTFGGLAGAPKFPSSLPIRLLLRYYKRNGDKQVLEMAENTLDKMAQGGIHDQVAGGFHRYSTDERWMTPHFEKMLYDNALLALAYVEAWQATGKNFYKQIAAEILAYIGRDMASPEGAFYAATDADSLTPSGHMEEGYHFTWSPDELKAALGKDRARIIRQYYNVGQTPNFEGRYIFHMAKSHAEMAVDLSMSETDLSKVITESKEILYQTRAKRPAPLRDEKIITAWNALMISAFAKAGLAFENQEFIHGAIKAVRFILDHLYVNNRLMRSYTDNAATNNGFLEDYAFLIAALMDLYESSHDIHWLEKAVELDKILEAEFEDKENGGFFMTDADAEELITRTKPYYDNAIPSGNSVQVLNLLRLYAFKGDEKYKIRAEKALSAFSSALASHPAAMSEMMIAVDFSMR